MKKQVYIKPSMKEVKAHTCRMLNTSPVTLQGRKSESPSEEDTWYDLE